MQSLKNILREPLLHFLILGAGIFLLYGFTGQRETGKQKIVITRGQVERLALGFTRSRQHAPTPTELRGLIEDHINEEVYYREAIAMGLDRDDVIIRRRLHQKLEFITDDLSAQVEPTESQLATYLKEHLDDFRTDPLVTFRQVFMNPERRGENLASDAALLLKQLKKEGTNADLSQIGDPFLLGHTFENATPGDVDGQFGKDFFSKLAGLPLGEWQGPVESGYGMHLVFLSERTDGKVPELKDVHDKVRLEWANAQRQNMKKQFLQSLLKKYEIVIEAEPAGESAGTTPEAKK